MKFIVYQSYDEILIVGQVDEAYNEQTLIRQLFTSAPEDMPESEAFGREEGFEGDRDPENYDREVMDTAQFNGLIIRLSVNASFR